MNDYLFELAKIPQNKLEPELILSSNNVYSLYFYPTHDVNSDEKTKFIIKFYNKSEEFYKEHGTYICKLHEPLSNEYIKQVGEAYNSKELTLDLSKTNILRVEIELHRTERLKPLIKQLSENKVFLTPYLLIKALNSKRLYGVLDNVFSNLLKKHVFCKKHSKPATDKVSGIRKLAGNLLRDSSNYYYFKNIANELEEARPFSEIANSSRDFGGESDLYKELYNKLFVAKKEEIKSKYLIRSCNSYSLERSEYILPTFHDLIYKVPIFDDS